MENLTYLHKQKSKGFWKARIFPSGDFTIGKNQPLRKDSRDHPLDGIDSHTTFYGATKVSVPARTVNSQVNPQTLEKIAIAYEEAGNQELADLFGNRYANEVLSGRHTIATDAVGHDCFDDQDYSNLGLSDATNSHKSPPPETKKPLKRGHGGISSFGKRMVKSCGFILEREYSKNCLSFLTATLPAFASPDELRLICKSWSELVRQFIQELRRKLQRAGYCDDMVYVTEIQEERYEATGEVAPHLHLAMVGKKHRWQKGYAIDKAEIRSLWERLLGNLLDRAVTCTAATRVERPRKSLQGELGSYLSKGGKIIKQIIEDGKGHLLPSSYWGASKHLKNLVKAEIEVLTGIDAQNFIDNLQDLHELGLVYFKPIMWQPPDFDREIAIGFVGWVRDIGVVSEFLQAA